MLEFQEISPSLPSSLPSSMYPYIQQNSRERDRIKLRLFKEALLAKFFFIGLIFCLVLAPCLLSLVEKDQNKRNNQFQQAGNSGRVRTTKSFYPKKVFFEIEEKTYLLLNFTHRYYGMEYTHIVNFTQGRKIKSKNINSIDMIEAGEKKPDENGEANEESENESKHEEKFQEKNKMEDQNQEEKEEERREDDESSHSDSIIEPYYAFDDDYERAKKSHSRSCKRVAWHRLNRPTCNSLHEHSLLNQVVYLSHGYFRDVFKIIKSDVVLKPLRLQRDFNIDNYESIRMDALIMESLTSSPHIVTMFGYCGVTIMQEALVADIQDIIIPGSGHLKTHSLQDEHDVDPQNPFSPEQKLKLAWRLALPLADMHGFKDGIIVHDDVQLCQYVFNSKNELKLNDFNRAEVMLYDEVSGKYCKYYNGKGHGSLRSPEEYQDWPLNEKIDVFSYGNLIYSILTGLWNFYGIEDDDIIQKKVLGAELPYVDKRYRNRSYAEQSLVNLMEWCWSYNSTDRPSIFQVIHYLEAAMSKNHDTLRQRHI